MSIINVKFCLNIPCGRNEQEDKTKKKKITLHI